MRNFLLVLSACTVATPVVDDVSPPTEPGMLEIPTRGELRPPPRDFATTGSTTVVPGRDGVSLFMVDPLLDQIVHAKSETESTAFEVGDEPTRITRVGTSLFITLRGAGEVVKTDVNGVELARVSVGLEPYGIVANAAGDTVYVAVSQSGEVLELDGETLQVNRRWSFPSDPTFLALDEDAQTLFVAEVRGDFPLHKVDLASGTSEVLIIPRVRRDDTTFLRGRVTGDMWVVPSTGTLLAPVLYIDRTTPVLDPEDPNPPAEAEPYGGGGDSLGRFNPAVFTVSRTGSASAYLTVLPSGRGYLNSVRSSPDDELFVATAEGLDALVYVDPDGEFNPDPSPFQPTDSPVTSAAGGLVVAPMSFVGAPGLPSGVTWTDEGPMVHSHRSRTWADGREDRALIEMEANAELGFNADEVGSWSPTIAFPGDDPRVGDVILGERLFFSAMPGDVGAGGVSCATCHFDGRDDGVSWRFPAGPTQTPSLAGEVSATEPVTWSEAVPSVAAEAMLTAELRMGGGIEADQAAQIQAFVDWTRPVRRPALDPAAQRGREIFERAEVGCMNCHNGARFTDGLQYAFRDRVVATPTLNGVGATAPYLRDGSAPDLHAVLDASINGGMGDTSSLSPAERDDLVAYLLTL